MISKNPLKGRVSVGERCCRESPLYLFGYGEYEKFWILAVPLIIFIWDRRGLFEAERKDGDRSSF